MIENASDRSFLQDTMNCLRNCFLTGIKSVQPSNLIPKWLKREKETIRVGDRIYNLRDTYVVGFGKAVAGMIPTVEESLKLNRGSYIKEGIISVPYGSLNKSSSNSATKHHEETKISIHEGAHFNLPDLNAQHTASKIMTLVQKLKEDDLLLVLVSGGGSALLPLPLPPLTLDDKMKIIQSLGHSGASIAELNTVRKAISATKGGKLAQSTKATVIAFILSDVINSPLGMIASGPTVENTDPYHAPLEILKKYNVPLSDNLKISLESRPPASNPTIFPRVNNVLIGDNVTALNSVFNYLNTNKEMACTPIILTSSLSGDAATVGRELVKFAFSILSALSTNSDKTLLFEFVHTLKISHKKMKKLVQILNQVNLTKSFCFLFGGETTVQVKGKGKGGRNQEMVLSASLEMEKFAKIHESPAEIVLLSGGTDGMDGPTDAAGAITFYSFKDKELRIQTDEAQQQGLSPESFLEDNNSYEYFTRLSKGKYLLKPGHTGTNVMDMQLLWIKSYH